MAKPATLADIARHAGVSKASASVVLNGGRSNVGVSEAVRAKIRAAAAELGYRPNALARSLSRRRTDVIGVYYGYEFLPVLNPFLSEVISGLQFGCRRSRQDLLLHVSAPGHAGEDLYTALVDGRVDGLALIAPPDDALAGRLAASGFPAVSLADALPGLPSIVVDDAGGMRLLAEYLSGQGHRNILYVLNSKERGSAMRRWDAFLRAGADAGFTVHTAEAGTAEGIDRMLEGLPSGAARPTAAVGWNEWTAHLLIAGCRRRKWRVPDDLAVVSFDGLEPDYEPAYRLTTVRAPWREVGERAVGLLNRLIDGGGSEGEIVLPVERIRGDTA